MEFVPIEVTSAVDGERRAAQLGRCDECGCEKFLVFRIDGQGHHHLQCSACLTSFCPDGACEAERAHNPPAGA